MSKDNHRRDIEVKYNHKYFTLKTLKSHKYRILTHTYNTTSIKKSQRENDLSDTLYKKCNILVLQ